MISRGCFNRHMKFYMKSTPLFAVLLLTNISTVNADSVVLKSSFEKSDAKFKAHGTVKFGEAGPRTPEFDGHGPDNKALRLDGNGSYLAITDEADGRYDFTNGDAITTEAWVKLDRIGQNANVYIIGKGRTGSPKFAKDNQNWSMRVVEKAGLAQLSFLFSSKAGGTTSWHRWTSTFGFNPKAGWHHIAISYRFGDPKTIQGWIDGVKTAGNWDIDGATTRAPVVDDDEVWVGSALSGSPSNSLNGWLDEVAVHRGLLASDVIASHYQRKGGPRIVGPQPEIMPIVDNVPLDKVVVTFGESLPSRSRWLNVGENWPKEITRWVGDSFLLHRIPLRYDDWGIRDEWKSPVLMRMAADVELPVGQRRLLIRARGLSRLWVDGQIVARTKAITKRPPDGEEPVTPLPKPPFLGGRPHGYHQQEATGEIKIQSDKGSRTKTVRIVFEVVVGGKDQRTESGETCVAIQNRSGQSYDVLTPDRSKSLSLSDYEVDDELIVIEQSLAQHDDKTRRRAAASQDDYWKRRHAAARRWCQKHGWSMDRDIDGNDLITPVDWYIEDHIRRTMGKISWEARRPLSDEAFLRRIYLDTVGVPPSQIEAAMFFADRKFDKRQRLIDRLLNDERIADHWISFWLDLLAENPTLINLSLNSTGPFRWFLHDSLRDHKPLDRMVTELIMMRGSQFYGGSAGFGVAAENDSPLAAKAHILASAFLGIELQCARCHDSPFHSTTQRDLYSLAAMLDRKAIKVPATSRVPDAFFKKKDRDSLIEVTLPLGATISPSWPFEKLIGVKDDKSLDALLHNPDDTRERLAALITGPSNRRFLRVVVNRIWKRLIGAGIVEPVHDWENSEPSHRDLLNSLAFKLKSNNYDARYIMRLIFNSKLYQLEAVGRNSEREASKRAFLTPDPRRMSAEQIVDSLFAVTESAMNVGELTFVFDGRRAMGKRLSLGHPHRAWMFASLNNERDRPSLALPRAQAVTDVLEAFGWTGSRQKPIHERDAEANVLQPGILANGNLTKAVGRAAIGSALANLAFYAKSPEQLVDDLFIRFLTRKPTSKEREFFVDALSEDFTIRRIDDLDVRWPKQLPPLRQVTWFNHMQPDSTKIKNEIERRVRMGPPVDPRLRPSWREVYEDVIWSLINHREFAWMP